MKFKYKTISKNPRVCALFIECGKNDALDYAEYQCVCSEGLPPFAPLEYWEKKKAHGFSCRLGGRQKLSDIQEGTLSEENLEATLGSLLLLLRTLEKNGLARQKVVFDTEYVFLDGRSGALQFVYLPVRGYVSTSASLTDILILLCEKTYGGSGSCGLRAQVLDYARRTTVLTGTDFEGFLKSVGVNVADDEDTHRLSHAENSEWKVFGGSYLSARSTHGFDFVGAQNGACHAKPYVLKRIVNGDAWPLGTGATTVGRSSSCGISLPGVRGMSRVHACLTVVDGACAVRDLGSTNGVLVNGRRIPPSCDVALERGNRMVFGVEEFVLQ